MRRGLTQEKLAEKLDLSPRHYQKLEAATVTPSFGVLVQVKKVLRVNWEALLGGA